MELLAQAYLTGNLTIDLAILGASGALSLLGGVLWWSLRRNIATIDRQNAECERERRALEKLLGQHAERLAVVEDRLEIPRSSEKLLGQHAERLAVVEDRLEIPRSSV